MVWQSCSIFVCTLFIYILEPTLPVLLRLRRYLRSAGRYGSSPFLIGHYGCIGEIAQGFCRAAAVHGAVYILGRQIKSIAHTPNGQGAQEIDNPSESTSFKYHVEIDEVPDTLECNLLISSPSYIPEALKFNSFQLSPAHDEALSDIGCIARCIAIIDQGLTLRSSQEPEAEIPDPAATDGEQFATKPLDTGILVFPPSSIPGGSSTYSATGLITGEGSLSTPEGKCKDLLSQPLEHFVPYSLLIGLVYIALPLTQVPDHSTSPTSLLRPYLNALLSLSANPSKAPISPLFTTYYLEKLPSRSPVETSQTDQTYIIPSPLPFAPLPDLADLATNVAERTFVEAARILRPNGELGEQDIKFWPPLPVDEDEDPEW